MEDRKSSEFHEKSAEYHRRKATQVFGENERRMEELKAEWHDDRAQESREIEEKERKNR